MTKDSPRDNGTSELTKRKQVLPRLRAGSGYDYDLYVVDSDGADKLLLRGVIDTNLHATLNSFMVMLHRANMLGPKSPSLERSSGGDPAHISAKAAESMADVSRVIKYMDKTIGASARRVIVDLCLLSTDTNDPEIKRYIKALAEGIDMVYQD